MTDHLLKPLKNTFDLLTLLVKHCKSQIYSQFFSTVVEYFCTEQGNLVFKVATQYSKLGNVMRNNLTKLEIRL